MLPHDGSGRRYQEDAGSDLNTYCAASLPVESNARFGKLEQKEK
jgi:hypothetical protein